MALWPILLVGCSSPIIYREVKDRWVNKKTLRFRWYERLVDNQPAFKGTVYDPAKPKDEDEWGNKIEC